MQNDIHENILGEIFQFLTPEDYARIIRVCKYWKMVAWKVLDFSAENNFVARLGARDGDLATIIQLLEDTTKDYFSVVLDVDYGVDVLEPIIEAARNGHYNITSGISREIIKSIPCHE